MGRMYQALRLMKDPRVEPLLAEGLKSESASDLRAALQAFHPRRTENKVIVGRVTELALETPVGGCFIADCWTQQSSDDTGMDARLEAGKIEFSVDNGMTFETAPQGDDNAYPAITNAGLAGGEQVSFTAEGGTVEAFSGSIQLPLAPMLLEPDVSGGGSQVVEVGVPSTQDLSLTWDVRGSSEWIVFQARGATDAPNFSCTFDAAPGGAIIPAEVLQHVGAGMEFSGVGAKRDRIVLADGYVEVVAHFDMVNETRTATPLFIVQ